jgi:hypothetical protein
MTTTPRRWYQFGLRTMFVLTVVVSIPLAWVGYSLNWIRQRREWRKENPHSCYEGSAPSGYNSPPPIAAPNGLSLFGEKGVQYVWCEHRDAELAKRLFPEAEIDTALADGFLSNP